MQLLGLKSSLIQWFQATNIISTSLARGRCLRGTQIMIKETMVTSVQITFSATCVHLYKTYDTASWCWTTPMASSKRKRCWKLNTSPVSFPTMYVYSLSLLVLASVFLLSPRIWLKASMCLHTCKRLFISRTYPFRAGRLVKYPEKKPSTTIISVGAPLLHNHWQHLDYYAGCLLERGNHVPVRLWRRGRGGCAPWYGTGTMHSRARMHVSMVGWAWQKSAKQPYVHISLHISQPTPQCGAHPVYILE